MISTTDLFLLGCCGLEVPRGCAVYRDNRTPGLLDPVSHRPQAVSISVGSITLRSAHRRQMDSG